MRVSTAYTYIHFCFQTIDSKEDVCIKEKNQNKKSAELHPDKGPECSSDGSSDEEEEDEEKESVRSDTEVRKGCVCVVCR